MISPRNCSSGKLVNILNLLSLEDSVALPSVGNENTMEMAKEMEETGDIIVETTMLHRHS